MQIVKQKILFPEGFILYNVAAFQYYLLLLNNIVEPQNENRLHGLHAHPPNVMQPICSDTNQPNNTSVGFVTQILNQAVKAAKCFGFICR